VQISAASAMVGEALYRSAQPGIPYWRCAINNFIN
jgi:hypothetical protein